MRTWNLGKGDPFSLTLAADARFSTPDYANDQIWELNSGGGEPPAFNLQTTFGLRARWLRLFPRFIRKDIDLIHPDHFHRPPALLSFFPNALKVSFAPFPGIDVLAEYWVPSSQVIAGRYTFSNPSVLNEAFRFEWIALLNRLMTRDESMVAVPLGSGYAIQGKTSDLYPVCVLSGAPEPGAGPFSALAHEIDLPPGSSRQITWTLASLGSTQASYELAKNSLTRPWDAELTRIELQNTGQLLEISTGNPEWDAALAFSQTVAYQAFLPGHSSTGHSSSDSLSSLQPLPRPSFVITRQPDHGYSVRGDGSDYPYLWSGQSLLDSYYLSGLILPGGAAYIQGLVDNFVSTQTEDGFIDWRPGLAGQRSRRLAQPLLAALACRVAPYLDDPAWIESIYPALLKFVRCWFLPEHDRDQDGFPEWDHPMQTGLEDAPMYDSWHGGSQGVEISTLESPSLLAFLYNECRCLDKLARRFGKDEDQAWLQQTMAELKNNLNTVWDAHAGSYRYRDRDTHQSGVGARLLSVKGSGVFPVRSVFPFGRRLQVDLLSKEEGTRPATIALTGEDQSGEILETITPGKFYWAGGRAHYTTQNLYLRLKKVEVTGVFEGDRMTVSAADYSHSDISLFLPLWAGVPDVRRAKALIERGLLKQYSTPFGLGIIPMKAAKAEYMGINRVFLPWNELIGEALLAYNYRSEATALVTNLMNAMLPSLKQSHVFAEGYHADNGRPFGERNSIRGLAPVGLFLQAAGIKFLSKNEIILAGLNSFPSPITVKYLGITITCRSSDTTVVYPNGQSISVEGPGPHRISLV
jgi:hypothetical protein